MKRAGRAMQHIGTTINTLRKFTPEEKAYDLHYDNQLADRV